MTSLPRPAAPVQAALNAHDAVPTCRQSEHLADYSFRFDTDAASPPHAVPRPRAGEAWTLAQTLQEVRLRRAVVVETSGGVRVRHAHLLADLDRAVRRHEPAVRLWLALGAPAPEGGWDDATALRARWLAGRFRPGRGPVALRPGVSVTDWARFTASVGARLAAGPAGPEAEMLRRDLSDLFGRHAALDAPAPAHAPARAA
jgi:hypothetical protein